MGELQQVKVTINGDERKLVEFTAFKAVLAGEILANASGKVEELVNKSSAYNRDYRAANTTTLTLGVAMAQGYVESQGGHIPDAAFDNETKSIDLPTPPSREQVMAHIFPEAYQLAKDELFKLIALALVDDAELQGAGTAQDADNLLSNKAREFMHAAKLREAVRVAATVVTYAKAQLDDVEDAVGELREMFQTTPPKQSTSTGDESEPEAVLPLAGGVVEPESGS